MGLFDFVKQHHAVGLAADGLRQLSRLIIAHVAWRRTDELGNRVLLHILGHIQSYKGIHTVEHIVCQALDKLGFAHARGTHKDKRHWAALGGDAHPIPPDGPGHGFNGMVLAHNMGFQALVHGFELLILLSLDFGGGDFGPELNNPGQIVHGHRGGRNLFQRLDVRRQLAQAAADSGKALKIRILRIVIEHFELQLVVVPLLFQLCQLGNLLAAQVHIRTGLVQKVNSLIGQKPVRNIALRKNHALPGNFRGNGNPMELGIGLGDTLQNLTGLLDGGLRHGNRLEPALQSGVLLDILAVLIKGGRAYDLNFSPGQRGL